MAKAVAGATLQRVSGRLGDVVLIQGRGGMVLARRPTYRKHLSPDQVAVTARLKRANEVWSTLTSAQVRQWEAYAATQTRHNALTAEAYAPQAHNVFVGLATKMLQMDAAAIVPLTPPLTAFAGDQVTLSLSTRHGLLTFTASAPNSAGVVTELLIQKLPNPRRSLTKQYKSAAFKAFTSGSMSESLLVEPGLYGAAYRFVREATGQVTEMLLLGVIEVA